MASIADLQMDIGVNTERLRKDLNEARKEINSFAERISKKMAVVKKIIIGAILAIGVRQFLGGVSATFRGLTTGLTQTASSFEQMALQLDILTKGKGVQTLNEINAWALKMPVDTKKAVQAFVTMQAFGLEPNIAKMQTLVDIASIFGEDALPRVSRALGQMRALGKLSAEELNQLSEVGISARDILQDAFGQTVEELQKNKVSITEIIDALWAGMNEKFKGAAIAGMTTWMGLVATLKSFIVEIQRIVTSAGLFDMMKKKLKATNDGLEEWIRNNRALLIMEVSKWVIRLGKAYDIAADSLKVLVGWTKDYIDLMEALTFDSPAVFVVKKVKEMRDSISKFLKYLEEKRINLINKLFFGVDKEKIEKEAAALDKFIAAVRRVMDIRKQVDDVFNIRLPVAKVQEAVQTFEMIEDALISTFERMSEAFMDWADTLSQTFTDMLFEADFTFGSILKSFAKMITQMTIQIRIIEPLLRGIFGIPIQGGGFVGGLLGSGGVLNPGNAPGVGLTGPPRPTRLQRLLGFAEGGVVPGPIGRPTPAIVHGGEKITPHGRGGENLNIYFDIKNETGIPMEAEQRGISKSMDKIVGELVIKRKISSRGFRDQMGV